jgi:hypothetical protein
MVPELEETAHELPPVTPQALPPLLRAVAPVPLML